jgi:hypothetical protein
MTDSRLTLLFILEDDIDCLTLLFILVDDASVHPSYVWIVVTHTYLI